VDDKYVLLVEDNPDDVTLTEMAFKRAKIAARLVVTGDGQEALDFLSGRGKYSTRDPNEIPALILLDLKLPLMSGLEVLREIRTGDHTSQIPVVVLTSSLEDHDRTESYNLGAADVIRKPIGFSQFVEVIRELEANYLA
jgi:two-component system response regulator